MRLEFLIHIGLQVDGVRIPERLHHAGDGSIHQLRIIHFVDIARFDEVLDAKEPCDIPGLLEIDAQRKAKAGNSQAG